MRDRLGLRYAAFSAQVGLLGLDALAPFNHRRFALPGSTAAAAGETENLSGEMVSVTR
jgi:hypothetical protein